MAGGHDLSIHMEAVARMLLGEVNRAMSKPGRELRFGAKGSRSVDLAAGTWFDHERQVGGGVLDLLVDVGEAKTRGEAVDWLREHGFDVPDDRQQKQNGSQKHPNAPSATPAPGQRRKIVATYDYCDGWGDLLYQIVRYEPKMFSQRRPAPDEENVWIWGLDAGEFMRKGPGKDWYKFDAKKFEEWKYTERRTFYDAVEHSLYNLSEVVDAIAAGKTIYIPEGEKDCETLKGWGLVATTNSGGARHWNKNHAEQLSGADVVIPIDNDEAGRARAELIAGSLHGVARRVRVLDLKQFWPEMAEKQDVTDWRDKAGGTPEQLVEIVRKLPDYMPGQLGNRRFALKQFNQITLREGPRYLVRGLIPRSGLVLVWGPPKCGKSFWIFDLAMHVALGQEYRGHKVVQGPVIYLVLEGTQGFEARVEAFRLKWLGDMQVPFYQIATRLNLVADADELVADIRAQMGQVRPALIVVDTLNRSFVGSESSDEDMTAYVEAAEKVRAAFECAVTIVHHCGIEGTRPRGHTALTGVVDAQIAVRKDQGLIQTAVEFMKDGDAGAKVMSRFERIEVGTEPDGHPITSLVVVPADEQQAYDKHKGWRLSQQQALFFRALINAASAHGIAPPPELRLPASVKSVVHYDHVKRAFAKLMLPDGEDAQGYAERIRQGLKRAREKLTQDEIIGVDNPYVWWTGRPVQGFAETQQPQRPDEAKAAAGEAVDDEEGLPF